MDEEALRILIRTKLQDSRLPRDRPPRVCGIPGNGEICYACETAVVKEQMLIEWIFLPRETSTELHVGCLKLHAMCFQIWESERRELA